MTSTGSLRILMTGDTVGGVWTFTIELASQLVRRGAEISLVTFGGKASASQREEAAEIPGLDWWDSDRKLEWMEDPWQDLAISGEWLLSLERRLQPDVIHLNCYGHASLPFKAPVVLTAHSCVASWWRAVKGEPLPDGWRRYREEVERSLNAADIVTAPTNSMAASLRENYDFTGNEIAVVPNGRNACLFPKAPKQPIIVTAGRLWDEAKNISAVADIASTLPWPVYVFGEQRGPDGNSNTFPGCALLGKLSTTELADWYCRASIFVLPAKYEPFGLSALEAALSGCVLVLGDIPSLREVWGESAIYVEPENREQIHSALRRLIDQPGLRKEMARLAENRARSYSTIRTTERYHDCYTRAIERRFACAS